MPASLQIFRWLPSFQVATCPWLIGQGRVPPLPVLLPKSVKPLPLLPAFMQVSSRPLIIRTGKATGLTDALLKTLAARWTPQNQTGPLPTCTAKNWATIVLRMCTSTLAQSHPHSSLVVKKSAVAITATHFTPLLVTAHPRVAAPLLGAWVSHQGTTC